MAFKGKEVTFHDIPKFGDHMPIKEWLSCCEETAFIDYDGFGNYATATLESSVEVRPSMFFKRKADRTIVKVKRAIPRWVTHIVWYNR